MTVDLLPGTYMLLGRQTQSADGQATYQFRGPDGSVLASITRNVHGRFVKCFGTARLPALGARGSGLSYHQVTMEPVDAITAISDYSAYVPMHRGWAYVERASDWEGSKLTLDYEGLWYGSSDTALLSPDFAVSGGLRAAPGDRLLVVPSGAYDSYGDLQPTYNVSVTVKAIPRHALWA